MNNKLEIGVDRFIGLFADVREGEGLTALLLMLNLLTLLVAYLVIKTVREALILAGGGAEVKIYAAAGHALLLLFIVPAYGRLASKVNRIKLINRVTLFAISNLILFYILAQFQVPLGVAFFLWVGIFNLLLVAQFWSFANDIYNHEQGKRLFAIVAFGGSLGAMLGPKVAQWLFRPLGAYRLMLVAAGLLVISTLIAKIVDARQTHPRRSDAQNADGERPLGKGNGFRMVSGHRYLLLIALLMVVANLVNTTGEFILSKKVTEAAHQAIAQEEQQRVVVNGGAPLTMAQREKLAQDFIGRFYGNFFFWVSFCEAFIQLFLVSRVLKHFEVFGALFILPVIALGSYSLIAWAPVLGYIQIAKILENSTNYSLQNTARQGLFLPTSREAKYKAKVAIDTFFVRMGDVTAAAVVFVGTYFLLSIKTFAAINTAVIIVWLLLVHVIGRQYTNLIREQAQTVTIANNGMGD